MAVHVVRAEAANVDGDRHVLLLVLDAADARAALEGAEQAIAEAGWTESQLAGWGLLEAEALNTLDAGWQGAFEAALAGEVGIFIYKDPME